MSKRTVILFLSVFLLADCFAGSEAIKHERNLLTTLAPNLINSKLKTTVASAAGTAVCPAPSQCHSRNCCSYYCRVGPGHMCLMLNAKPFCLVEDLTTPAADLMPEPSTVCVEARCDTCAVSTIFCGGNRCDGLAGDPMLMLCNFDSIRGPIPAAVG